MKHFSAKTLQKPSPVESGKGRFPALFPWNQDLHRSVCPHEWILTSAEKRTAPWWHRLNVKQFSHVKLLQIVQSKFWIPQFLRKQFFEPPLDETHVHANYLKRATQWYLKWFSEVSQVLTALAWRCTQWFPVFLCVFWAPCWRVVFLKWHPCFQNFAKGFDNLSFWLTHEKLSRPSKLETAKNLEFVFEGDGWHGKMGHAGLSCQWWDPALTVRPNKNNISALTNPQKMPTFQNYACSNQGQPFSMVTGRWNSHATWTSKCLGQFHFTHMLTHQILLDVQQLLPPVKSATRWKGTFYS